MEKFVTVKMTDRERVTLVNHFRGQGAYNADSPEAMLALGEVYDSLGLEELDNKIQRLQRAGDDPQHVAFDVASLSDKLVAFRLSKIGVFALRSILARPNQPNLLARLSLGALRRLPAA